MAILRQLWPTKTNITGTDMADSYWVTWPDESNGPAAQAAALIWGPQASAPAQLSGWFEAGPFATEADAQTYKSQIGTGAILPAAGTPIVGDVTAPLTGINAIGDFFQRLTQSATWIRVAEVALGTVVIVVALNKLMGNPIGKTSKTVAKAAAA